MEDIRIACLLPSATDICIALGLSDKVVGITHECNLESLMQHRTFGDDITSHNSIEKKVNIITKCGLNNNDEQSKSQAGIDAQVQQASRSQSDEINSIDSIYPILEDTFRLSRPTIVITQNLCNVCAPSVHQVETIVGKDSNVKIISLDPHSLQDVADTFTIVAQVCGVPQRGKLMRDEFLYKLNKIGDILCKIRNNQNITKKKVLLLEWIDPPYDAGHWLPDMIEAAGCIPCKINPTTKSKRVQWEDIYSTDPDVVLVACCGFDVKRNLEDTLKAKSKLEKLRAAHNNSIFACNGDMHFTRPGPALIEGVCTIARCAYENNPIIVQALNDLDFLSVSSIYWGKVPLDDQSRHTSVDIVVDIEDSCTGLIDYMALHDTACNAGKMTYTDPESGYQVFTELAHKKRGKCCGCGCKHCPFHHENVKDKALKIMQPAFLFQGNGDCNITQSMNIQNREVKVVFFSGGKDSFLAIRSVLKSYKNRKEKVFLILLTTFDATSRIIAHQDIHIDTIIKQATHLNIPLVGVPLIRSSKEPYVSRIKRSLDLIVDKIDGKNITSLVFGDLYLEEIRNWREKELQVLNYKMEFPLWKVDFDVLIDDLNSSGVKVILSASNTDYIKVDEEFNTEFVKKVKALKTIDLFGENGEYHTVVKVWVVPRTKALGIE